MDMGRTARRRGLVRRLAALACAAAMAAFVASCDAGDGNSGNGGHGDPGETSAVAPSPVSSERAPGEEAARGGGDGGGPADDGKIRIGFSMDTLQEERWQKDRDMFKEAAEALGAEVVVMEANADDAKQISQAESMIGMGVDLLVVVPHNAEAMAAIVKKAHSAGIKVLSYDRLIKNSEVDFYISFDNVKVGELKAEAITRLVPRGKYVYIGGADTDNNAHLLKEGVFNVLQPSIDRGDITVVYDQWTKDWKPANALVNIQAALAANGNRIDAVIAGNDAVAGSVVQALSAAGLAGIVPVAGQDAELAGVQRIVEGTQTMTVYKPIRLLADKAADLAVRMARGETVEADRKVNNGKIEVPSVLLQPIAVDKRNIDGTVVADGFHKREDVYKKPER